MARSMAILSNRIALPHLTMPGSRRLAVLFLIAFGATLNLAASSSGVYIPACSVVFSVAMLRASFRIVHDFGHLRGRFLAPRPVRHERVNRARFVLAVHRPIFVVARALAALRRHRLRSRQPLPLQVPP